MADVAVAESGKTGQAARARWAAPRRSASASAST